MSSERIRLLITPEHPCSYLPERQATTAFVDPDVEITENLYTRLSQNGFRRSGRHVYRPSCRGCHACVPVRVPVAEFTLTRRFRRTLRANADLSVDFMPALRTPEVYDLYESYIQGRHDDGDMYPPTPAQFDSFLSAPWSPTRFVGFRDAGGRLLAVAVVDTLADGLSAIYTFFSPDASARSLGTFAILWEIEEARRLGLDFVYLGYWIRESAKMRYKLDFRPTELFTGTGWERLEQDR